LQDQKTVLFGVPDCGKICSEQHLPGYLKAYDDLRKEGISQIICVAVSDPAAADAWGKKIGADGSKVLMAADPIQATTRILGMELAEPSAPGPKSLRYAAILDNGVILKMVSKWQKEAFFCGLCALVFPVD
jgi:peroxiredoxin